MVEIFQGEIWWAELDEPVGSRAGFRRPVIVIQCDALNRSRIATVVCIPLASNLKWAEAPGNVLITSKISGLAKDSVANASQITALDRVVLTEKVGKLPARMVQMVLNGIDIVLGK